MAATALSLGIDILRVNSGPNARGFYEAMGMVHVDDELSEVLGPTRLLPVLEKRIAERLRS